MEIFQESRVDNEYLGLDAGSPVPDTLSTSVYDNHKLTVSGVSLSVTTWSGSWWTCGCCRRATKRVLTDIDVTMRSGEIVALIGNSGSGKTSLLNVISGRQSGTVEGSVVLNNHPLTRDIFSEKAGYVIQADRLLGALTVRETLDYTAKLRFHGLITPEEVKRKVERSLRQMKLSHVSESFVGGILDRGISGGEKRRLSIAVQLLQDPDLLLLDEPTTGLDSFTAHYLVETLSNLARYDNKMVVLTIHQPRSDIFRLLDTVGILSGGNMVYYGPRGDLVPYFTGIGYPCPTFSNPLDFYIDIASVDRRSDVVQSKTEQRVQHLREQYRASEIYAIIRKDLEFEDPRVKRSDDLTWPEATGTLEAAEKFQKLQQTKPGKTSKSCCVRCSHFFGLVGVILRRLNLFQWRDKPGFINRIMTLTLFAFFNWIFCWRLDLTMTGIQERIGIFYQTTSFTCTIGVIVLTPIFPPTRSLYDRESGDGLYNCLHFLIAYYIHVFPFHLVSSVLFGTWLYWSIGMYPDVARFAIYVVVCFVQQLIGEMHGLACLGIFTNPGVAQAIATLVIGISSMYAAGFLKSINTLFKPLTYFTYINHFKYASAVLAANELVGLEFDCSTPSSPNCTIPGEVVLEQLLPGAQEDFAMNCGILVVMVFAYWLVPIAVFFARGRKVLH